MEFLIVGVFLCFIRLICVTKFRVGHMVLLLGFHRSVKRVCILIIRMQTILLEEMQIWHVVL